MPKYVIERDLPGAGQLSAGQLQAVSRKSNEVLEGMAGRAQWLHSYVTDDKLFWVYIADSAREHRGARRDGRLPVQPRPRDHHRYRPDHRRGIPHGRS
ncbi:MAG TPA: nickel-binding protein [Streptosporangiaceae bacterium]|jgi:hypothetical protein